MMGVTRRLLWDRCRTRWERHVVEELPGLDCRRRSIGRKVVGEASPSTTISALTPISTASPVRARFLTTYEDYVHARDPSLQWALATQRIPHAAAARW